MNIARTILIASAGIILSCTDNTIPEETTDIEKDGVRTIELTADDLCGPWKKTDKVSLMDDSGNHKFITAEEGKTASFTGECSATSMKRTVISPYDASATLTDDEAFTTLPSRQSTLIPVSVGTSSTESFKMHMASSILRFSTESDNLKKVTISGLSGETLSGKMKISSVASSTPVSSAVEQTSASVVFTVPGETIKPGRHDVACIPVEIKEGISFDLEYDDGSVKNFQVEKAGTVKAGEILDVGSIEAWPVEEIPSNPYTISLIFIEDPSSKTFLWPFESPTTKDIPTSISSASFPSQEVTFTMPESAGGYKFKAYATSGFARNSGSGQGFKMSVKNGDYLTFPVIPGKFLARITMMAGETGALGLPEITTADGTLVSGGNNTGKFTEKGESHTWNLFRTSSDVEYRMTFRQKDVVSIQQLIITYDDFAYRDPAAEFANDDDPDQIPDFSRVGYHWGDREIPQYDVKMTLEPPADGSDATKLIQNAINSVPAPGAILLKAGRYNISGTLTIERDGVVLRGEGDRTVLYSTATTQISSLIKMGTDNDKTLSVSSPIVSKRTAVGRMYVAVRNPELFAAGDKVFIYRPGTDNWIADLHMNEIAQSAEGDVSQWKASTYNMSWERTVTKVDGYKIWLDNPVVMELNVKYGGGSLYKGTRARIKESGIENLYLDTRYDESKVSGSLLVDEDHCWSGIVVHSAEHCWIKGVSTIHFGYASVALSDGAKNITVQGCKSFMPVSQNSGSRRYAFSISSGQLCLVRDCWCERDRHQYVTGSRVTGPNVYLDCVAETSLNDAGPHCYWATGTLFDNVKVDGDLIVMDRSNYGSGHGWAAVNTVFYNCEAARICAQSPWVTGQNWAIGCIGQKIASGRTYGDNLGARPDGIWTSPGTHVTPRSLYESQLQERHSKGDYVER